MKKENKTLLTLVIFIIYMITWRYYGSIEFFKSIQDKFSTSISLTTHPNFVAFAHFASTSLWLGVFPLITYRLLWGQWLAHTFFKVPSCKEIWSTLAIPITFFFVFMSFNAAFDPSFKNQYPFSNWAGISVHHFLFYALMYAIFYYIPWEFFFRGQIQFMVKDSFGYIPALACQLLPSVLIHIGKPSGEIYGSLIAGLYWGYITEKTGSILVPLVMHIIVGVTLDLFLFIV